MQVKIKKHNKQVFFVTLLLVFFGFNFNFSLAVELTPEQQASANRANYNAESVPSFSSNPTTTSTIEGYGYYETHGALDPVTGQMIYAQPGVNPQAPIAQQKNFKYTLLESFPGFFRAGNTLTDLPALILAIYKFGIWTVGIAGLFMLVVGGFMRMTSAGNTSSAGSAKRIIGDALLGIVAALGAYLILYVINPDLTKITIGDSLIKVTVSETMGTPMGEKGVCKALSTGDCSVANLAAAFGSKATEASSICNGESRGKSIPSGVDLCADGKPASWGLFQINITAHKVNGLNCPDAFSGGAYTSKNHNCRVKADAKSQALYQNCVKAASTASINIATAKSIYTGDNGSWRQWGANRNSNCNFK